MLNNQRGNAIIEIVPILAVFVLLVNFSLGFFGLIHSGILNSIAARNYAFETFRNRAHLGYLRDIPGSDVQFTYTQNQQRLHTIVDADRGNSDDFKATRRSIKFSEIRGPAEEIGNQERTQRLFQRIREGRKASEDGVEEGTNFAWIKSSYGICLTAKCGN
jgi:hypothetical protein